MAKNKALHSTKDFITGENLRDIIHREVKELLTKGPLEGSDIARLEKLAKIHTTLMADLRENMKSEIFKYFSPEELKELDKL